MNDMENLRTFADQLWKYMVPKLDSKFASNVSYFRAQVVSNLGNNKLEVQRPMENGTLTLPCVRAMSNAQPGQQVVALVMGSMSNAIVVGDGNLNVPGGGGDVGIANFQAQPDGSLVITLINGNTLTATPHDPTKQDVLTFDDVPTQGSNNPVKSGGVYTALDNKVDKVAGKGLSTNDYTTAEKNKLAGIETGAQVNQNAFANVKVGSTTIAADAEQDTLELAAGNNITITPDATNDKVTIATTAEVNQNAFSNVKVGSTTIAADSKQDTLTLNAGGLVNITGDATNDSVTISVDPNHTHITTQVLDLVNADSYGPSGMVSFDADVAEVPLKNCVVNIEPLQAGSGDPSPTNIRAISGWTRAKVTRAGKNFADCSKAESGTNAGITYSVIKNEEGSVEKIVANGTITAQTPFYIIRTATGFPAGNYIFTAGSNVTSDGIMFVVWRIRNGASVYRDVTSGNDYSLDIQPTDEIRLYLRGETSGTVVNNVEIYPMMRLASETDRTFEPYQGQTIDISFPSEAGTVYGGTLDVLKGTLTVDRAIVDLGDCSYTLKMPWGIDGTFQTRLPLLSTAAATVQKCICSRYMSVWHTSSTPQDVYNGHFVGLCNRTDSRSVAFYDPAFVGKTGAEIQTALAGQKLVYPLENPITYQLSPQIISTLLGSNSIWADCGTISVDYGAFLSAMDKAIEEHSGDDIRHITEAERTAWDGKQDALTFDNVPTSGSSNPVKSSGIYTALAGKANTNHTHDASDITSGILPAARGGTGNGNGYIQIGQESGTTLGSYATAEGNRTTASGGPAAHAEGEYTSATGNDAPHAEGYYTKASGNYAAHAEGYWTTASGQYGSHAEGMNTVASGNNGAHAEGHNTVASGDYGAHADGDHTIAAGRSQHVFGAYNVSNTTDVEIVGWGAINARKNIRTLSNTGNEWIAGTLTQASDARLKDVQGEIPDLSSIRAIRFRWKNGDDKEHLGYLAQDVEEIAPYLVDVDSNGYKSLDYIALLTAKVEMLEQEIEKLKQ